MWPCFVCQVAVASHFCTLPSTTVCSFVFNPKSLQTGRACPRGWELPTTSLAHTESWLVNCSKVPRVEVILVLS